MMTEAGSGLFRAWGLLTWLVDGHLLSVNFT